MDEFLNKTNTTSVGQEKGRAVALGRLSGVNKLSLNIDAARAVVSAPTTPVEAQSNIGYECVVFGGQGQGKRRREESTSPAKEVVSRMAERLLRIHDQLDRECDKLVSLVKANSNTKVEIKSGINTMRSLVSQISTVEMRAAVGNLAGKQEPARHRTIAMADAETQVEGEGRFGSVHRAIHMAGDCADQTGQGLQGPREDLESIRRAIQGIQAQLDYLVDKAPNKGQRSASQRKRQEPSGGAMGAPRSEAPEGAVEAPKTGQEERAEQEEGEAHDPTGGWAEVVRRGKKAGRREAKGQSQPSQGLPDRQTENEGGRPVRLPKARPTRVMVSTAGTTYKEVLGRLKGELSGEQASAINGVRRSEAGNIVMEVHKGTETQGLIKSINEVLGGQRAKLTEGSRCALEIKYLEEDVTPQEVTDACDGVVGRKGETKVVWMRRYGRRAEQVALIECSAEVGRSLLQTGKVRVGWNTCRIAPRRERLEPCWRCRGYGHRADGCEGPDRRDSCRRCGRQGHKEAGCTEDPRCMACEDKGMETGHFAGSTKCGAYAEAAKSGTTGDRRGERGTGKTD